VHIYLTDTLESPNLAPPGFAYAPLFHRKLAEENERARRVKARMPILVCIGNPPYFRQVIEASDVGVERQGGWVRRGDRGDDGILRDFLRDVPGVHAKNLYNLYVYFWRWALWKVFESTPGRGVVSFITASSYLRGPGFAGMRRFMRETLDDLWILDLGERTAARDRARTSSQSRLRSPSQLESDMTTPTWPRRRVCTTVGLRDRERRSSRRCERSGASPTFRGSSASQAGRSRSCPRARPTSSRGRSSPTFSRGSTRASSSSARGRSLLIARYWTNAGRLSSPPPQMHEPRSSGESRDRKVNRSYPSLLNGDRLPAVDGRPGDAPAPAPTRYGYRTLDRQYCLADNRLGDFLRPTLWRTLSARQLFMTSLLTDILGSGPAVTVTHLPPDLHHFSGRGGKDIVPLWRDAEARKPNIAAGLLENLPKRLARMSTLKNSSPTATHSSPRRDTSSASPRSSKYRARVCR